MAVRVPPIMLPVKLPLRAVTSPDEAPEVFVAVRGGPIDVAGYVHRCGHGPWRLRSL